ncbi:hypothetical protein [Bacillus sp. FSL K6-6540]|uniref:hypothetical protein n=1 Tax=Bacillus sp. FSL K6-6540 TaxID=2921512 RepID=UPI0030F88EBF
MRVIRISIFSIVLMAAIIVLVIFAYDRSIKLQEARQLNKVLQDNHEVERVNEKFLKAFFNYHSTSERYDQVKDLMTEAGYRSTYPSGDELPPDTQIESSLKDLRAYKYQVDDRQYEFLNEFVLSTVFNSLESERRYVFKTVLIRFQGDDWKVDHVEFFSGL